MDRRAFLLVPAATFVLIVVACGAETVGFGTTSSTATATSSGTTDTTATGTGGATTATTSTGSGGGSLFDAGVATGGSSTGGATPTVIYASTDTDLYTLDPADPTLTLTHVGAFDCIPPLKVTNPKAAMVDIAVNAKGELWGVTGHDAYPLTIQGPDVHCGDKVVLNSYPGPTFYALTFAPEGSIADGREVLVAGNTAGELWAYDPTDKSLKQHGSFGVVPDQDPNGNPYPSDPKTLGDAGTTVGKPWELSGDIVFLANGGAPVGFATVRDCPFPPNSTASCSYVDTLIEIDMAALKQVGAQNVTKAVRGQVRKGSVGPGCSPSQYPTYGSMFGIAAWSDLVFGFSRTGQLVRISNVDGTACLVHTYSGENFSGAAVTTLAPVAAPPPVN